MKMDFDQKQKKIFGEPGATAPLPAQLCNIF
jgi:hypothetical protein